MPSLVIWISASSFAPAHDPFPTLIWRNLHILYLHNAVCSSLYCCSSDSSTSLCSSDFVIASSDALLDVYKSVIPLLIFVEFLNEEIEFN